MAWYIFPALNLSAFVLYASAFVLEVTPSSFMRLTINPLVFPFYCSTMLFTIPQNVFTAFALVTGRRRRRAQQQSAVHPIAAGVANLIVSVVWFSTVAANGWMLTR